MVLCKVETSEDTLYAVGRDEGDVRDKVNTYLKERHFGGSGASINSVKLLSDEDKFWTNTKLIL